MNKANFKRLYLNLYDLDIFSKNTHTQKLSFFSWKHALAE